MNQPQQQFAERFINLFEHSGPDDFGWGDVENLDDGRGYTAGVAGFTPANGDALEVVREYGKAHPHNRLTQFIPELERLAREQSGDVSHLRGFAAAWTIEATNETFHAAQEAVREREYFGPARELKAKYKLESDLAEAILDDAAIQYGCGDDPDGLPAVLERTADVFKHSPKPPTERDFLSIFLSVRRRDLRSPHNRDTAACWAKSTGRVDVWEQQLRAGNLDFKPPFKIRTRDYNLTIE